MARIRRKGAALVVGAAMAMSVTAALAPAGAQTVDVSPAGEMLIVTTNLQEAWQTADMRSQSELDNYVERLLDQVPYVPDVLMLQEVRRKSGAYVRDLLSDATGDTYKWALRPPRRPWTQNPKRRTETDSAILFNAATTRALDGGGYISLTYRREHAADKVERVETTRHARLSVSERAGELELAAASVHLQYGHLLERYVDRYQTAWTNKLARALANAYPDAVRNVGGDFNQDRCATKTGARDCTKSIFWRNLIDDPWNYSDALYEVFLDGKDGVGLGGVDFIFTTGAALDAGSDTTYDKSNPNQFYSDHRFFWAVVGS